MAETTTTPKQAPAEQTAGQQRQGQGRPPRRDGGNHRRNNKDIPAEEKMFDERVIHIDRVARVVKGGRRFRFRALVVVGDRKGKVGIGLAKGADVTAAVAKATEVAKKHLQPIIRYKDTIPHEVDGKVGGARILIMPASSGTGLIAGGVVRTILEIAGISNALSKSLGSSNKANIAYATLEALSKIEPSEKWVTTKHKAEKNKKQSASAKVEKATKKEDK